MTSISVERFKELTRNARGKRIAIIGDVMLDRYLWGTVQRISPEAPVPVVDVEEESSRLGGAANVANNVSSLGAEPVLIGITGDDSSGYTIRSILEEKGFTTDGLIVDSSRPSTVKTRVIAHNQQVVRTDRESREPISGAVLENVKKIIASLLPSLDAVILQDYNKGFLIPELIDFVCTASMDRKAIVTVDPKFSNFFSYRGVSVFKPNQREVEMVLGRRFRSHEELIDSGREICGKINCENLLITRGEKGMLLFERCGEPTSIPTRAKEVHDVSGAGDTVISALTVYLAGGASVKEAAAMANYAAGVVCGEVGVVPVNLTKLEKALNEDMNNS